jgi:hypothetical protein
MRQTANDIGFSLSKYFESIAAALGIAHPLTVLFLPGFDNLTTNKAVISIINRDIIKHFYPLSFAILTIVISLNIEAVLYRLEC